MEASFSALPLALQPVGQALRLTCRPSAITSRFCWVNSLQSLGLDAGAEVVIAFPSCRSFEVRICAVYETSAELAWYGIGDEAGYAFANYGHELVFSRDTAAFLWKLPRPPEVAASVHVRPVDASQPSASARRQIVHALVGAVVFSGFSIRSAARLSSDLVVVKTIPHNLCVRITNSSRIFFISENPEQGSASTTADKPGQGHLPTASKVSAILPSRSSLCSFYDKLRELVLHPALCSDSFKMFNALRPPSGVLLRGPPGVGKTFAVRRLATECAVHVPCQLFALSGSRSFGKGLGDTERALRRLFQAARQHLRSNTHISDAATKTPLAIVFLDEIDALCPRRGKSGSREDRVVAQLLTLMDGMKDPLPHDKRGRLVVIGATNRPDAIDIALRRPGRFEREIQCPPPRESERAMILEECCGSFDLGQDVDFERLAAVCVGFVGADLAALAREASLFAARRGSEGVMAADLEQAAERVGASSLRRSSVSFQPLEWNDIGGLASVKHRLRQVVEWPIAHNDALRRFGVRAARGVLLHGPAGCSKTSLVRAAVTSARSSFFSLSGADVYSAYVGEAEHCVRRVFADARAALPAVIFFDEIDVLVGGRSFGRENGNAGNSVGTPSDVVQSRVLSTLLNEMDGVEQVDGLLVIAATNRIDVIDAALLRPGRFDVVLFVPPPDYAARLEILRVHTRGMPLGSDVDLAAIATRAENKTGADLAQICREAGVAALRSNIESTLVTMADFELSVANFI